MRFLAIPFSVLFITGCATSSPKELREPPHRLPLDTYTVIEKTKDGLEILDRKVEEFVPACAKDNTCSLKKIEYRAEKYRIFVAGSYMYSTHMKAAYETEHLNNLTEYIFVQFVRGCLYQVFELKGKRRVSFQYVRDHFEETVRFCHPEWTIDSIDRDPAYQTWKPTWRPGVSRDLQAEWDLQGRHHHYKWDDARGTHKFGVEYPEVPKLFVEDHPTSAFYSDEYFPSANNTSLEFKTCLYRAEDVPGFLVAAPGNLEEVGLPPPIHCFEWRSSSVYNWKTKKFEHPRGIVPACFQKPLR